MHIYDLKICKLVMSPDMSIVSSKGHEEMYERKDNYEARHGGQDEHHLPPLHVVLAEHLDLRLPLHQHVDLLRACREHEVKGVKVNHSIFPAYLVRTTNT